MINNNELRNFYCLSLSFISNYFLWSYFYRLIQEERLQH